VILLIETSHRICSVAVCDLNGKIIWDKKDQRVLKHAEALPVLVNEAVQLYKNIQAVALSKGPGSYTGLRIGASLAQGLCFAKKWPLIGIPTHLGMINYAFQNEGILDCLALIHAGRDEAYTTYWDGDKMSQIKPQFLTNEYIDTLPKSTTFIGDCVNILPDCVEQDKRIEVSPEAIHLASTAAKKWVGKEFEDLAYFTPLYTKDFIPGVSKKFKV